MKKLKMNKVIGFLLVLVSILCISFTVNADTVVDDNRNGSIAVILHDQIRKKPIADAGVSIYKVANTKVVNNNLEFEFTDKFKNCGLLIDDYYKVDFAKEISNFIKLTKMQGTSLITNADGIAQFTDLTHGIYLVMQNGSVENYFSFSPFVSVLPITQENKWVYDLDVSPKMDAIYYTSIIIEKVWNDNGADVTKRPQSVKIQLLSDGKVIDTVVLSEENGWKHIWGEMVQRDDYSVKEVDVPKGYKASYKQRGFDFTVTNTSTLAQTGQLNWPIPILIICGLVLIAVGYILRIRGKKHE